MTEHDKATPRPWKEAREVPGAIVAVSDAHMNLLGLDKDGFAIFMNSADVALVVAAVNSYDASRALIEQMRDALLGVLDCLDPDDYPLTILNIKDKIAAAEKFLEEHGG